MNNIEMSELLKTLKNKLVVSCQARGNSPFNSPEGVTMLARAAQIGGASGIRSEGIAKTKMIIENVNLPVIGLVKSEFANGFVRITGSFKDVEDLMSIGTHIIAIDGTFRRRENITGPEFISRVKSTYDCIILADVAQYEEGISCFEAGADAVSTTLSGYTPETVHLKKEDCPDYHLLIKLAAKLTIPVFAEGRINTPQQAAAMISNGAWGVITGSAITSPEQVTRWYIDAMNRAIISE